MEGIIDSIIKICSTPEQAIEILKQKHKINIYEESIKRRFLDSKKSI